MQSGEVNGRGRCYLQYPRYCAARSLRQLGRRGFEGTTVPPLAVTVGMAHWQLNFGTVTVAGTISNFERSSMPIGSAHELSRVLGA